MESDKLLVNGLPNEKVNGEDDAFYGSINRDLSGGDVKVKRKSYKFSIAIMIMINFLDFITFSIIFPSLLYYIQTLGGDETFYSWTLTGYSLAQAISAPFLGYWASKRTFKEVMAFALVLEVFGSVAYSIAQEKWTVFISRVLLGISAGSSAATKAYMSATTTADNRTTVMMLITLAQTLGFVAGPGIGGIFAYIDWRIHENTPRIILDKYTTAGWFSAGMGLCCLILTIFFLKQPDHIEEKEFIKKRHLPQLMDQSLITQAGLEERGVPQIPNPSKKYKKIRVKKIRKKIQPIVQKVAVIVLLYNWFTSTASFTIFETLNAPVSKDLYDWDVKENAWMWLASAVASILGMMGLMVYYGLAAKVWFIPRLNDKVLLIITFCIMITGLGILIQWDGNLHLSRWIIAGIVISLGLPVNQSLLTSLYSLVLDEKNQGTWMGYMTTIGCTARILSPLGAIFVYKKVGFSLVFILALLLLVFSVISVIVTWCYIKPHPSQVICKDEEDTEGEAE